MMAAKKGMAPRNLVSDMAVIPRIAALLACGKTRTEIAQELNLGFSTVARLAQREECQILVKEIGNSYLELAKATAVKAVSELTELAIKGLKKALEEGNVQAVRTHFQVIGLIGLDEQKKDPGTQSLTIVMPGAHVEKPALEVESGTEVDVQPGYENGDDNAERGI